MLTLVDSVGIDSGSVADGCNGCGGYMSSAETVEVNINAAHSGIIKAIISRWESSGKHSKLECSRLGCVAGIKVYTLRRPTA